MLNEKCDEDTPGKLKGEPWET